MKTRILVSAYCAFLIYGCGSENYNWNSGSLFDNAQSRYYSEFDQKREVRQISKKGSARNLFFSKDNLLHISASELEYELSRSDFSPRAIENLKKDHAKHTEEIIALSDNITKIWGETDVQVASENRIIKYSDNYKSRSKIDFSSGAILIETIDPNYVQALKIVIINTILAPQNPSGLNLYNSESIRLGGKPFLAGMIKDQNGKDVIRKEEAQSYANYLIENKLQTRKDAKGENVYFVQLQMSDNFEILSSSNYQSFAKKYAKLYDLDPALVMAIIRTESNFNPYAMSHIPAYGLMQIVPSTAGADIFEMLNGKKGQPTKDMLFTPETNIQYGTTYLYILKTRYLKDIKDPISLEYCMISSYNAGAGNMLKTFHQNRKQAIDIINSMSSEKVYKYLSSRIDKDEAREYLKRVRNFKKQFIGVL